MINLPRPASVPNLRLFMFSLAHKTAIVTGAASGIGLAIAQRFIAVGALVLIADRRAEGVEIAQQLKAEFVQVDVASEDDIEKMFETAQSRYGHVDILASNAGIQPLGVGFEDLSAALMERTMAVNVNSVALGIKHASRRLSDGGRIINTASFVGMIGAPKTTAYAASKAAVIHLTKLGAIELAPRRITVNAISPGTIRTPAVTEIPNNPEIAFMERRTPLGRLGEPEEVAALCHFLASDEAAYITGQNIAIDGGLTAGWTDYDLLPPANVSQGRWHDDV
jgi:NAD(P)-dependent dehydrogenase (short-subunit alcohol dehydrogenase family)